MRYSLAPELLSDHQHGLRPLRIVQMGPTGPIGGVSAVVTQLSAELARQGHEVLVVGDGADKLQPALAAGATYEEIIYSRSLRTLAGHLRCVRRLLSAFRPDVIHVHGRAPALLVRCSGFTPDWFTLHNTHFTDQVSWYDRGILRRALSPLGRAMFALDPLAVEYLRKNFGVGADRVEIVPNGIDCGLFRPGDPGERADARARYRLGDQDTVGLFVGRFHDQKNPLAIIKLVAAAKARGNDSFRVLLVGEGPLEVEMRSLARTLGVEEQVHFHGWSQPLAAYQAADVFLMPSRYEGYGLAAAEALACGTPVLRSRTGGFDYQIREGVTGWGCDGDSEEDFIRVGLTVVANPGDLRLMRTAARRHAVDELGLDVQARRTVEAYRSRLAPRT